MAAAKKQKIRQFIITRGLREITTANFFPEAEIVIHSAPIQNRMERRHWITNTPDGSGGKERQIRWVMDNLLQKGEWGLFLDDNINNIWRVKDPFYSQKELTVQEKREGDSWKDIYENPIDGDHLISKLMSDIQIAERIRANFWGVASTPNFYFNGKHYHQCGFILGKMWAMKNVPFIWPPDSLPCLEDWWNTCAHLYQYGRILRNNFIHACREFYEPGGFGSLEERIPMAQESVKMIMHRFPGLLNYKKGRDWDVSLRIHTPKQIDEWRKNLHRQRQRNKQS